MPDKWNPNATQVLGLEWFPHTERTLPVTAGKPAVILNPSIAAETIRHGSVYVADVSVRGDYYLEVIPLGSESPTDTTVTLVAPNEDFQDQNASGRPNDTAGQLYTNLTDSDGSTYLEGDGTVLQWWLGFRFAVGTGNFDGRRILSVGLRYTASNEATDVDATTEWSGINFNEGDTLQGYYYYTARNAPSTNAVGLLPRANPDASYLYMAWPYNPFTRAPWRVHEVERFDTADTAYLVMSATGLSIQQYFWDCSMEIVHCEENRAAFSGYTTITGAGWYDFDLQAPQGGGLWSKLNATDYLYVLRRSPTSGGGSLSLRALYGDDEPPNGSSVYPSALLDQYGRIVDVGDEEPTWAAPVAAWTEGYLNLTGASGSYASTTDKAALDITGDVDLWALLSADDWTPASAQTIVGKWTATGNQRSYRLWLDTNGKLNLSWSTNGTAVTTKTSTVALTDAGIDVANGGLIWVRALLDSNNGAAGNTVYFFWSYPLDQEWAILGAPVVTAGTTSIFSGSSVARVGATEDTERFAGKIEQVGIRPGDNAAWAAYANFSAQANGAGSFADGYGNTWTINSPASIVGRSASGDTQPYVEIPGPGRTITQRPYVDSTHTVQQEFSGAAAIAYRNVRALVTWDAEPNADLLVKIKRRSDNVQVGGTLTIAFADVRDGPFVGDGSVTWFPVNLPLASDATLAAATQYYVEFSSTTSASAPWYVLGVAAAGSYGYAQGFGGTTDRATWGGTEADQREVAVTVSTIPTAPAGLSAGVAEQDLDAEDDCDCAVDAIEYVAVTWTATALGGSFDHYELQRSEDAGATWATVQLVDAEATAAWDDYETRRGVAASYRIRVHRRDGAMSAWSAATAGVTAVATAAEWAFVSNEDPSLNVAYNPGPEREYEFPSDDEAKTLRLYERDYQVVLRPTEDRGVRFELPLTVSAVSTPATVGLPVFDALRAIATAGLAYVCVLDSFGNRWLADLSVPSGRQTEPDSLYVATVTVTEVSDEFSTAAA